MMDGYPTPARAERIADGCLHVLGVTAALIGAGALVTWAAMTADAGQIVALTIYATALIATFTASAAYNMGAWFRERPLLQRLDHAAIYFKIAGTYTPIAVMAGHVVAYGVLAVIWALAILGVVQRLVFWRRPGRWAPVLYLAMGWMSLALVAPLWPVLPGRAMALIAIGGLIYSLGVLFFIAPRLRFSTAIWHGFVLVASGCFFAAIVIGTAATA